MADMGHQGGQPGHRRLGSSRSMERQASDLLGRTTGEMALTYRECINVFTVTSIGITTSTQAFKISKTDHLNNADIDQ